MLVASYMNCANNHVFDIIIETFARRHHDPPTQVWFCVLGRSAGIFIVGPTDLLYLIH